ncbi:MAG: hypothetical protein BWK80_53390 [Desulfobacteraceae bacterium IS3]|nr:MAG: hypothetical protein BWK80_53390 [Desulfobacteraceae bacterium IS3]
MKESLIADTGFWIALFDGKDKNHFSAKAGLKFLFRNYQVCVSDFIIFETVTYLSCSVKRHDIAVRFLNKIRACNLTVLT